MYKIAICDDEKSSAADAAELLEKYRQTHYKVEMSVDIFYTSLDLLGAIEKESYDIYLLDIYIDKMNGIEIAEAIRKIDENGQIIFMTSSNAFYKEAFRIHAVHYLEKPILEEDFFDAIDRVCVKEEARFLSSLWTKSYILNQKITTRESLQKRIASLCAVPCRIFCRI